MRQGGEGKKGERKEKNTGDTTPRTLLCPVYCKEVERKKGGKGKRKKRGEREPAWLS